MKKTMRLTKRKQAWVGRRSGVVLRGAVLNNQPVLEAKYAARVERAVGRMADQAEKEIRSLFESGAAESFFDAAQDESIASQARILTNQMMDKLNAMFSALAPDLAEQQVEAVNSASSSAVHSSLKELSGGLSLPTRAISADMREIVKASIAENVGLIKTISQQYLSGVQGAVMRSITTGNGLADLVPFMKKHREITHRRARMIAYDQTRKAYNALNRGRMESVGLAKFEWLHTGGSDHPRQSHIALSGQVFSFDDLPIIDERTGERGIPGQAINCRCRMRPVLDLD